MENASKALIIAGAILLSILLISLGIMVYTNARGSIGNANLDSEEIQAFNTKISQYCGKNKSANEINSLVSAVAASNGAQKGKADAHYIDFELENGKVLTEYYTGDNLVTGSDTSGAKYPTLSGGKKYRATYTTDSTTGYINKVSVAMMDRLN